MKLFMIAGEPSGDHLGANLIQGFAARGVTLTLNGVAGPHMQAQGCPSLFPMIDLSVMGLAEVLPKYFHLKRRIRETAQAILDTAPDVVITIDSPDFCLRVARIVKAANPNQRIVHYVAPSVWAWRPKRAVKMAAVVDHVLALLPFEPPFMQAAGVSCDFVGHPIAHDPVVADNYIAAFRECYRLTGPTLTILPGSRRGEIKRLMPIFADVLKRPEFAGYDLLFPTLPHLIKPLAPIVRSLPQVTHIIGLEDDLSKARLSRRLAMAAGDAALIASGTVSLDLASVGTPMVVAYDVNWFSRLLLSQLLRVDTVTLVNLVSNTRDVPEFLGANCTANAIAPALQTLLQNPMSQDAAMQKTMQLLGRGGDAPGLRAADSVLQFMGRVNQP